MEQECFRTAQLPETLRCGQMLERRSTGELSPRCRDDVLALAKLHMLLLECEKGYSPCVLTHGEYPFCNLQYREANKMDTVIS